MENFSYLKPGDTVTYLGQKGKFLGEETNGTKLKIVIDGKVITVNPNDLFGMNENKTNFNEQISFYDDIIEKNKEEIKENNTLYAQAKRVIKKCKQEMYSLLSSTGVRHYTDIQDSELRKKYEALSGKNTSARSIQIGCVSDILTASHETSSAAIRKKDILNMQSLYA